MNTKEIIKSVNEVVTNIVKNESEVIDQKFEWPEKSIKALQHQKITGLVVPTQYGGLGKGMRTLAEICELISKESASVGLCFGMHCVGSAIISAKPSEHHIEKFLKPIAKGEHITTLSLSEKGTGAHFYYPLTTFAKKDENSTIIDGNKTFVTNGGHADSYVISVMNQGDNTNNGHFSCFMLEGDTKGIQWQEPWEGIGMRGNSSRSLLIDKVEVPSENLLGEEGDQLWYVFNVVAPYFLTAMSGTYLGIAQAALDEAKAHLMKRAYDHSGAHLSEVGILQHKLGMMWSKVERTRQLVYFAASEADSGGEKALPAICSAKIEVAKCAVEIVNEAMTICGGIGYRKGGKLERLLRDARAAHVMSPTTDLLATWIGRFLLEQPILD